MQFKKITAVKAAIVSALTVASFSSYAALPAGVATTVADVSSNATGIFDLVFPVVGLVLGLLIVIKLFKKFTNKI